MAAGAKNLERILALAEAGRLRRGARICDIGVSELLGEGIAEAARSLLQFYIGDAADAEHQRFRHGSLLGDLLEAAGFAYTSLDLFAGKNTILFDLNINKPGPDLVEKFDLVLNFGTTEHVIDQYRAHRTIYDLTNVAGVMYHDLPLSGYINHGYFQYSPKFFQDLALANGCDIWFARGSASFEREIPTVLEAQGLTSWRDYGLEMMLLRRLAGVFRLPLDGLGERADWDFIWANSRTKRRGGQSIYGYLPDGQREGSRRSGLNGAASHSGNGLEVTLRLGETISVSASRAGVPLSELPLDRSPLRERKGPYDHPAASAPRNKEKKALNRRLARAIGDLSRCLDLEGRYVAGENGSEIAFDLPHGMDIVGPAAESLQPSGGFATSPAAVIDQGDGMTAPDDDRHDQLDGAAPHDPLPPAIRTAIAKLGYHPFIAARTQEKGHERVLLCPTQNQRSHFCAQLAELSRRHGGSPLLRGLTHVLRHQTRSAAFAFGEWLSGSAEDRGGILVFPPDRAPFAGYWGYPIYDFCSTEPLTRTERTHMLLGSFEALERTTGNDETRRWFAEAFAYVLTGGCGSRHV